MGIIIIIGLIEAALGLGALIFLLGKSNASESKNLAAFDVEIDKRATLKAGIEESYSRMVGWQTLRDLYHDLTETKEVLKLERGRVTITQAELETVENRLRELDEVDREIQASGLETKEELRILNKKEKDLRGKNDQVKLQIAESLSQLDALMSQVEMNAQITMQVESMKSEMLRTEQKVDELLMQIELGNEQYFILKQVYDALDIEYAQLYEKFSESNSG